MYKVLTRNLKSFFKINSLNADTYRLKMSEILIGFMDINLYEKWKLEDRDKYDEINNLVFEIQNNTHRYHTFKTLSSDLWGYGYNCKSHKRFSKDIVDEQLKLINMCLKNQYILD